MRAAPQDPRARLRARTSSTLPLALALAACGTTEPPPMQEAAAEPARQIAITSVTGDSTVLGILAGPKRERELPFYGTDLGWTFPHGDDLWVMFGDTWLTWISNEIAEDADDALGKISLKDFPDGDSVDRWMARSPARGRSAPSWHTPAPPLRIAVGANGFPIPMRPSRDGVQLTSGPGLTPMAGFSNMRKDGRSAAFGIFLRNEPVECAADGSCANGFECDPGLGQCAPLTDLSATCVIGTTTCNCVKVGRGHGLCQDRGSSVYDTTERGRSHSVVMRQVVGNALRGADTKFPGQSWDTRRFYNLTVRSFDDFDERRAGGVGNRYKAADGVDPEREGIFIWGRPNFGGPLAAGRDAQTYLAWVPMPDYDERGHFAFEPRFFAGLDPETGRPTFSDREIDAAALDLDAATPGVQPEEVKDTVGQVTVAWIENQQRFVMMYGGGWGNRLMALIFGSDLGEMRRDPFGTVYLRYAPHPWGPWSAPEPVMISGNPHLGVIGHYGPGGALWHDTCMAPGCAEPEWAYLLTDQFEEYGAFYAPSIVDPWTEERPGNQVDLYWHTSTWNPYQVLLVRTRLPAP